MVLDLEQYINITSNLREHIFSYEKQLTPGFRGVSIKKTDNLCHLQKTGIPHVG